MAIWALFTVPALAVTLITGIFTAVLGVKAARTPSHTTRVPEHREQPLPHMLRGLLAGTLFAALVLLVLMAVP